MKLKLSASFWFRSIFFTLLNRFSLIFFGVVGYMILAKKVFPTANEMGVWGIFLAVLSLVETVKQGLLRNPMIKFLSEPEYADQKNKVQSVALLINFGFSALVILLIIFLGNPFCQWLNFPELYPMILWGIFLIILLIPFNHFEVLLQANFRFKSIFLGYLFRQGIFLTVVLIFLFFFKNYLGLIMLVKLQIFALFSGMIVMFFSARDLFFKGFVIDKILLKRMLHFGKYIFGTNVFSALSRSADQFITANQIQSEAIVAYYNVVSRINNLIDVPSMAVADVLFPKNVEAMAQTGTEKVRYYFERMIGSIISILGPLSIVIFLLPKLIIKIIAGDKYMAAVTILRTVILFSFLRPFAYQFGATMDAIGKPKINFWINLLTMSLNILFIFLGLHFFGWKGAAYGSVIGLVSGSAIMYAVLVKTIGARWDEIIAYVFETYENVFIMIKKFLRRA
ncbi:MAG TPA: oligosaccharide flippase family protein [Puia sp.]|nr:oligosaccharide flippase family protein [Puia sp.]